MIDYQSLAHAFMAIVVLALASLLSGCDQKPTPPPPYPMMGAPAAEVQPYPFPDVTVEPEVPQIIIDFPPGVIMLFPAYNNRPMRGVEVWEASASSSVLWPHYAELQPDFVKMPIRWSRVEIAPDVYVWPSAYDRDVAYLRSQGITPFLTIKAAPDWARSDPRLCGRPDNVQDYAEFAGEVAARYPGPLIIEVWNEPDTSIGEQDWYGCLGDPNEPYYGGGFYRSLIEAAYPAIKAGNPEATVLAGALALPLNRPVAEYIQAWGDSPAYDGVSFHYYSWYAKPEELDAEIDYLRRYTDRPLWLTETAVLGTSCGPANEANAAAWAQIVRSEWRLSAATWFILQPTASDPPPWGCVGMLDASWNPKPVYEEWK